MKKEQGPILRKLLIIAVLQFITLSLLIYVTIDHSQGEEFKTFWLVVEILQALTGLAIYIIILRGAVQMFTYYELYRKRKLAPILAAEDNYNKLVSRLTKELETDDEEFAEISETVSGRSGSFKHNLRSSVEINDDDISDLDDDTEDLEAKFTAAMTTLLQGMANSDEGSKLKKKQSDREFRNFIKECK